MIYCVGEIIVEGVKFSNFEACGYDQWDLEYLLKEIVDDVVYMDTVVEACADAIVKSKKQEISTDRRFVKLLNVQQEWDTPTFIVNKYNKKFSELPYCKGCEEYQPNQLAHTCLYPDDEAIAF